jgi:hypothetical protein
MCMIMGELSPMVYLRTHRVKFTRTHTHTYTHTHTHTHTHKHTYTHTYTHTHRHTLSPTRKPTPQLCTVHVEHATSHAQHKPLHAQPIWLSSLDTASRLGEHYSPMLRQLSETNIRAPINLDGADIHTAGNLIPTCT